MVPQTMPAISVDINMLWQMLNFLVLIFVFNKYLKTPLMKVLKERKEKISQDIDEARKSKERASEEEEEARILLRKAKQEAHKIITSAEKKADARKEEILKNATSQRDKILKSAEVEMVKMKEKARREVRIEMQTLAVTLAEKIINEKLDTEKGNILIDDFINEIGEV